MAFSCLKQSLSSSYPSICVRYNMSMEKYWWLPNECKTSPEKMLPVPSNKVTPATLSVDLWEYRILRSPTDPYETAMPPWFIESHTTIYNYYCYCLHKPAKSLLPWYCDEDNHNRNFGHNKAQPQPQSPQSHSTSTGISQPQHHHKHNDKHRLRHKNSTTPTTT